MVDGCCDLISRHSRVFSFFHVRQGPFPQRDFPAGTDANNADTNGKSHSERNEDDEPNSGVEDDDGLEDLLEDIASGVDTTTLDITNIRTNSNIKARYAGKASWV